MDIPINVKKSKCLRFCARYNCGDRVEWVDSCRYVGVYWVSAQSFGCSFRFRKVGRYASEDVLLSLVSSTCLPVLFYVTEECPLLSRDLASISFALTRVFMKIFRSRSSVVINEYRTVFGILLMEQQKMQIRKV